MKSVIGLCAAALLLATTFDSADARSGGGGFRVSSPRISSPRVRTPRVRAPRVSKGFAAPRSRTTTAAASNGPKLAKPAPINSEGRHLVQGYMRKDGKYVQPYWARDRKKKSGADDE